MTESESIKFQVVFVIFKSRPVHRLRKSFPSTCAPDGRLQRQIIPGAVLIKFDLLMMSTMLLETCRGL